MCFNTILENYRLSNSLEKIELISEHWNVFNIIFGNLYKEKKSSSKIKLLLNKFELKKIQLETKEVGSTLIPTKIFTNDNGIAKIQISIAKGKKLYDKRNTIKERENRINLKRKFKY